MRKQKDKCGDFILGNLKVRDRCLLGGLKNSVIKVCFSFR